jgi:hypothetical protein
MTFFYSRFGGNSHVRTKNHSHLGDQGLVIASLEYVGWIEEILEL